MGAAFMVSYARAKSEGLGFSGGPGWPQSGSCPARSASSSLSVGLIAAGATANLDILSAALAIIAVGATITVIQRIVHVRGQAKSQPTPPTQ